MNIRANATFRAGDFARLEARILPKIIRAVTGGTEAVLQNSLQNVPVDSGELASSAGQEIEHKGQKVVGSVSYTASHASFNEFGTGIIGAGTYPYPLPQEGVPYTGSWIYDYKRQNWRGMVATPYLRPALDQSHGAILDSFRAEGFQV